MAFQHGQLIGSSRQKTSPQGSNNPRYQELCASSGDAETDGGGLQRSMDQHSPNVITRSSGHSSLMRQGQSHLQQGAEERGQGLSDGAIALGSASARVGFRVASDHEMRRNFYPAKVNFLFLSEQFLNMKMKKGIIPKSMFLSIVLQFTIPSST